MRVAITGATGNIGTALVEALSADAGVDEIVGIARRRPHWFPPKTRWVTADVATDDLTPHLAGADAVVHLAWLFQPTRKPEVMWHANVEGSARVFEAAARAGVGSLVYSSSVGAYSPGPKTDGVDESWPTMGWPAAAYAREKSYVERLLDAFELEHPEMRVVRLRPGFIFQPPASEEQRRIFLGPFVPSRLVRPGMVPVIPDLPGLRFQVLHAVDVADAFRRAVQSEVTGAFNVAAEPVVDAALLAEVLDARVVKLPEPVARSVLAVAWRLRLAPVEPGLLEVALRIPVMDTTRARTELGWTPRVSAPEALRSFIAGLQGRQVDLTDELGGGATTPPLDRNAGGWARWRELATGVGGRANLPDETADR